MNLIVTCARHLEPETETELRAFLDEMGDPDPEITVTDMSGILTASTRLDPVEVTRGIRDVIDDEPWRVRYCLRVIPVQTVVDTELDAIEEAAAGLACSITEGEKYRITVENRNSDISSQEIIKRVAGRIGNRVSLEFPDKVVLVEVLEGRTGVSVVERSDVLSTEKAKRSASE